MQNRIHSKKSVAVLRRKRGTPVVGVQVDLAEDAKDILDAYTSATGLPQWAILEAALRAGTPGPNGYPEEWELPVTATPVPLRWAEDDGGEGIRRTA